MEALEQRVSRLYQYIGDQTGDIFASAKQVQRLEELCHQQQLTIQQLQSQQDFFQRQAAEYFEQQVQAIVAQKGIRNTDFISLTKFFTQSLIHAVTTVQTECSSILQSSLPLSKIQELESQVKRLQIRLGSSGNSANSGNTEQIQELESRVRLLEIQSSAATTAAPTTLPPTEITDLQNTVAVLQEHVKHLEDNLITEVQKHYKMTTKQGELAAPLVRMQQMVQTLNQEFQSFRGMDPRKVAEAMIATATENLRTEFQTSLATRASKEELERFDTTVRRIEQYSTDVQTGFYKMKQQLEQTEKQLTDRFSDQRWNRLETSLQQSLETKHKTQLAVWNSVLDTQQQTIQQTIDGIQKSADRVMEDARSVTSPEAFQKHLHTLQRELLTDQQGWLQRISEPLQAKMAVVEAQSQQTRSAFLDFTSEVKTELSASALKTKYAAFESKLAEFEGSVKGWNQRLQKAEESHTQVLAYVESRTDTISGEIRAVEKQFSEVHKEIAEVKQAAKKDLSSWMHDRKGEIQKRFTDATEEVKQIQRNSVALEGELYKQLEIYRGLERSLAEKFRNVQAESEKTVVAWREEQMNYIISRMTDFSTEIRKQLAATEDRLAEYGGQGTDVDSFELAQVRLRLAEINERFTEINLRLGPVALQTMKTELENTMRAVTEEWLKKRADGIMSKHIHVFQDQLTKFNETVMEDRIKFMKRYELLTEAEKTQIHKLNEGLYKDQARRLQELVYSESETVRVGLLQKVETQIAQQFNAYKSLIEKAYVSAGKGQGQGHNQINPFLLDYQSQTKCIYTALFGTEGQPIDTLSSVRPMEGWDYICFTNLNIPDTYGWKIVRVDPKSKSMALEAKRYKWLSHKYLEDYDIVIWTDAYLAPSLIAADKLYQWITLMKEKGVSIFHRNHESRTCIWDECDAVIQNKRDTPEHVQAIKKVLQMSNMPTNYGLYDTNIMIKFNKDTKVKRISEDIMKYLENYTTRDQLVVTLVYYVQKFAEVGTADLLRAFEKQGVHVRVPAF
jgi:hypothetical protein